MTLLLTGLLVANLQVTAATINVPSDYSTISAAVAAASPGDVIVVAAGTYTEAISINKNLEIRGANFGIDPNTGIRVAESVIFDGSISILGANTVIIDGFHIYQTNTTTPVSLGGGTVATIQYCIVERFGVVAGSTVRGIEISAGAGVKNITNNKFTGDDSGGLFGTHKTWNSGLYVNCAGSTVNIEDNVFENCRSALNLDDFEATITVSGNTFDNNGTHASFGGTSPTTGSYTWGANEFKAPGSAIINLSNVTTAFRLDITAGTFNGTAFSALSLANLFNIEAGMFHRSRSGRNGLVYYVADNLYVRSDINSNLQTAIDYAAADDVINVMDGTYIQRLTVSKSLTIDGQSKAGVILEGTGLVGTGSSIALSNNVTDVTIQDLTIQNYAGSGANTSGGIYAPANNNNLTIDNIAVQNNTAAAGIYANGPIDNVSVTNSMVANHGPGARGIVIWNGLKTNISITGNMVTNNNCCGIELQDGDGSDVDISNNTINIGGGDNAIGVVGLSNSTITGNTITGGGRFGIEIKNPAGGVTVSGNSVTLTTQNADVRDRGGIIIMRRGVTGSNVDVPTGVTITNNTVVGYQQTSVSEGFGIVVEGTDHTVTGNTVQNSDVGIIQQQNPSNYPGDADQNNIADQFFGRGNSPITCGNTISGNTFSGNGVDFRNNPAGLATAGTVTNMNTSTTYCSLQAAIDAPTTLAGHTISLLAGTYYETIVVNKELTILGPNASIDPCVGTPVAEAIIMPPTSQPFYDGATEVRLLQIEADNVTIKGITFDGDNPALTNSDGGAIDAADGIDVYSNVGGITVENNIFKNLNEGGVTGYPDGSTSLTGNTISNNLFDNLPGIVGTGYPNSGYGIAVLIYNNFYAAVENNCMTNLRIGIQTGNFNLADAANSRTIAGNTVEFNTVGIWYNLHYQSASTFDINNNQITTTNNTNSSGLFISSVQSSAAVTVTDNNVTGAHAGIEFWNNPTTSTVTATGGTLDGCNYGVFANNYDGYSSDAATSTVAISGVSISGSIIAGVYVKDNPLNSNNAGITLIVQDDCTIIGTGLLLTGILVEGSDATATVQSNDASISGFAIGVDVDGGSASLYRNSITANGTGVRVINGGNLTTTTENYITLNTVDGIRIEANSGTIGGIHDNDLSGNTGFAINDLLAAPAVDATCNWYGSTVPATVAAEINGNVTYTPWLTSGTDNAPTTDGFQPIAGCSAPCFLVVTCPADQTVCENEPAYALTGESPSGGTYSGTGVSGGLFNAAVAGTGTHTITYSYTDLNGCTNTCTFTITVNSTPTFTFTATTTNGSGGTGDTNGGPTTVTLDFCLDEYFSFSNYSSVPGTQVGYLEEIPSGTNNVTYNGSGVSVPRAQQDFGPTAVAGLFSGPYGPYSLSSGTSGSLTQTYTPYYDADNSNSYTPGDCLGDPITLIYNINATPQLETTINTVQVTSNNDGADDLGAISVCNSVGNNLFFTQFEDIVGMAPSALVKVEQLFALTNVTFGPPNGTFPLSAYATPFDRNVALVNPVLSGTLEMRFRAFFDTDNDNVMDAGECAGDWIVYTVTVNPIPVLTCPADQTVCEDEPAYALTGESPSGGTYSGTGVSGGLFDAATAGTGTHTITYSYTDGNGCSNTCTFAVTVNALPTVSFDIGGSSVVSDNDGLSDPEESATVEVCDGGTYAVANLVHSSGANRYQIAVTPSGGVLLFDGSPAGNGDISAAQFDGAQGTHTITLSDPSTGGTLVQVITPYNDVNGNNSYDAGVDCPGDPITLTYIGHPVPLLEATINTVQVTSNNDGVDDLGAFSVCNTPNNILFNSFVDLNGLTPASNVKAYQTLTLTNVTVPFCNNCAATLAAFAGASGTAALVNPALPGTLEMRFRAFFDTDNDNVIDAGECAGDWIVYTITVSTCCAPPEAICQPYTAVLGANGQTTITAANVDGGSTYDCGLQSVTVSPNQFNCSHVGTPQTVTLTVTDINGDSDDCQATVTVTDNMLPIIVCPNPITVNCADKVPAPNTSGVTAADNCSAIKSHHSDSAPYDVTCANRFKINRTYKAVDPSSNSKTCVQVITVYDQTKPNFTSVPANTNVQCNNIPAVGSPVASDNCGGAASIIYNGQTITNILCVDKYTIIRQWTAMDACGNTRTTTQRITVVDTQKPNFDSSPPNITVQCTAIPAPVMLTATDNCDAAVAVTYNGQTRTNGSCLNDYVLIRRWTAEDNCGNTRLVSQRVKVVDNGKPALTVPANTTIACNDAVPPVGTPTASDGCDGAVNIVYLGQTTTNAQCQGTYQIKRTWRATDVCGNSTAATQTIQVLDSGAPVFTSVPGPITIECDEPLPPLVNPTATDACNNYVHITFLGQVPTGSGCEEDYTITRTWRAEDLCGNSETATQVITMQGNNFAPITDDREQDVRSIVPSQAFVVKTLHLQPNPSTDRVWIDLADFAGETVTVSIFGELSQLVWEQSLRAVEDLKISVSLREAGATAGIYTISVRSSSGVVSKRLVLVE